MCGQGFSEIFGLDAQQEGNRFCYFHIADFARLILPVGLEFKVAKQKSGRHHTPYLPDKSLSKLEANKGGVEILPHLLVVSDGAGHSIREVPEIIEAHGLSMLLQSQTILLAVRQEGQHLIEDMEIPLVGTLSNDPALLQEIVFEQALLNADIGAIHYKGYQFPKTTGIVVLYRLGITKGLENRVAFQNL